MACLYDVYIFGFIYSNTRQSHKNHVYVHIVKYSSDDVTRQDRREKRRAFRELFSDDVSHGAVAGFLLYELLYELKDCEVMPCIECVLRQEGISHYSLTKTDISEN